MRYDKTLGREEGGAVGWVSLADALIAVLVMVLTISLLAQGALRISRQENTRLRAGIDASDSQRTIRELNEKLLAAAKLEAELREQLRDSRLDRDALETARETIVDLRGKLAVAERLAVERLAAVEAERKLSADKIARVNLDNEFKFAGIAMTGKSVVFVVDTSGSMERTDEQTLAPNKWPTVCATVAKVMQSIPTLEKYQVIRFSKQARWLSADGGWQQYDREKSATAVKEALLKVKPEDDTNLYDAFELAFSLRTKGLDTIYLFSDGLPTCGKGLTPAQENANPPLKETERSELLSEYLRMKLRKGWNTQQVKADRVRINAIGFFYESPDVGAFLWALARENEGSFVGMSKP